ncbi:MAG TPA: class I SAM-dependent methyltransferase [Candidatus Tumulicola sp.]|jgi:ubiquinone/menaquinone biosynthesis C-methylase UbiE
MSDRTEFRFAGNVPEAYDKHLVAPLFEPMAHVLLAALGLKPGERLLDVACGPGSVARVAARHAQTHGRVTGCDVSSDMIAVARSKSPEAGSAAIEYVVSPAAPLPFANNAFDAIACQQGLQFFPDKVAALSEMRRVLTREGRVAIVVFRPPDGAQLFTALRDAARRAGVDEVDAFFSEPFSYGSVQDLQRDLESAGFSDVAIGERSVPVVFNDGLDQAVSTIRGIPFWPAIVPKGEETIAAFEREAREGLQQFLDGDAVRIEQYSNLVVARP